MKQRNSRMSDSRYARPNLRNFKTFLPLIYERLYSLTMLLAQNIAGEAKAIGFRYLSTNEVHGLSVKAITVPLAYDQLGQPVFGGLYDPALGPMEQQSWFVLISAIILFCSSLLAVVQRAR